MKNTTIRDTSGRYSAHPTCEACRKPITGDYLSDDETCNTHGSAGLILCDRVRCSAKRQALPVALRVAYYTRH